MIQVLFSLIFSFLGFVTYTRQLCMHQHFAQHSQLHFYDDLHNKVHRRFLKIEQNKMDNIRIYADYRWLFGTNQQNNLIIRVMDVSANFFSNMIKVQKIENIKFPSDQQYCSILRVPQQYYNQGVNADLGILVLAQKQLQEITARSKTCALLKSNNRPIWGFMNWSTNYLEFDQLSFQKFVLIAIHQFIHILAYSPLLFDKFPTGNPIKDYDGLHYLASTPILRQMRAHFKCQNPKGLLLQDQDGYINSSHNEFNVFGNEVMAAVVRKGAYISRFSAAILDTPGWYEVNYDYTESTTWGKNKGCRFINPDNCDFDQFCKGEYFSCTAESTAIGKCQTYLLSGSCKIINYFSNTICTDENYSKKNLNSELEGMEKGGHMSRCHSSNLTKIGIDANQLNFRCYTTICSASGSYLYIKIGEELAVCQFPGAVIKAPNGLQGILTCPLDFSIYCKSKNNCAFSCNKNGVCINGKCLCRGASKLTYSCPDIEDTINQNIVFKFPQHSSFSKNGGIIGLRNP